MVAPPKGPWAYDRTGLLYFARPHSDTVLTPIHSPVLEAAGVKPIFGKEITMAEWVVAKQKLQLNPKLREKQYAEGDGTVDVIAGFKDRVYK